MSDHDRNDLFTRDYGSPLLVPEECPHLIWFDDTEKAPLVFVGAGARPAALRTWEQQSKQWNGSLFVRVASNSRDDQFPSAIATDLKLPVEQKETMLRMSSMIERLAGEVERLNELVRDDIDDDLEDPDLEKELCEETDELVMEAREFVRRIDRQLSA
ncbi:hypothetical protein [Pseudomonas sp. GOM6]|uniref:hypothetical protein n=1 Tax=Pseudomonas sp. GOM6 TaxID=3036944 RepID=UPI002409B8B9|nr:hypothetical protein [Pseudomonas sp. GOM6]MDG1581042.1 hypothetical protein [Pseudomonas sp. GOM6]